MRVSLKLLHEMDLVNFINDLRSKARAFIRVRELPGSSCQPQRQCRRFLDADRGVPDRLDNDCTGEGSRMNHPHAAC